MPEAWVIVGEGVSDSVSRHLNDDISDQGKQKYNDNFKNYEH